MNIYIYAYTYQINNQKSAQNRTTYKKSLRAHRQQQPVRKLEQAQMGIVVYRNPEHNNVNTLVHKPQVPKNTCVAVRLLGGAKD